MPAHEGLKAASHQIEPGEKKQRRAPAALPDPAQKRIGTSRFFLFDSNLEPNPHNLQSRRGQRATRAYQMAQASTGGKLRSSGMLHEGSANPING